MIPATTPPQLQHTPGAPLTITDNQIDADWFRLTYPDGWRVVTNIAIEPVALVLVSPDDALVIRLDTICDDVIVSTSDDSQHMRSECFDDVILCPVVPRMSTSIPTPFPITPVVTPVPCYYDLHISASVNDASSDELDDAFDQILDSIVFP
ncbi:MAG: hypothetical protein AAF846_09900 [Chloroflexota bacterium]